MKNRRKNRSRNGVATMVGLVVIAIVGATMSMTMQDIALERRNDVLGLHIRQADLLADDLGRLTQRDGRTRTMDVTRETLGSFAGLHLETAIVDRDGRSVVEVFVETVADELPFNMNYSVRKTSDKREEP